jgi:hypothetical protein
MKRRIKKIRTMILCDSVYDLRLLNKVQRATCCSFFFFFLTKYLSISLIRNHEHKTLTLQNIKFYKIIVICYKVTKLCIQTKILQ